MDHSRRVKFGHLIPAQVGGDGASMVVPRRKARFPFVGKHVHYEMWPDMHLQVTVAAVARGKWERGPGDWAEGLHPIAAGPIVILVGVRWVFKPGFKGEIGDLFDRTFAKGGAE
ncbi:hypothetical protein ACYOEI_08730 [Singulisphaera rosea]